MEQFAVRTTIGISDVRLAFTIMGSIFGGMGIVLLIIYAATH